MGQYPFRVAIPCFGKRCYVGQVDSGFLTKLLIFSACCMSLVAALSCRSLLSSKPADTPQPTEILLKSRFVANESFQNLPEAVTQVCVTRTLTSGWHFLRNSGLIEGYPVSITSSFWLPTFPCSSHHLGKGEALDND